MVLQYQLWILLKTAGYFGQITILEEDNGTRKLYELSKEVPHAHW